MKHLAFLLLFLGAITADAATVTLSFTNRLGVLDTNMARVYAVDTNILINGGVIARGLPIRLATMPTNLSMTVGTYAISNAVLGSGLVFQVPDDTNTYTLFDLATSGYNSYFQNGVRQIVAGTNISVSPANGKGVVTISSTGAGTANGITNNQAGVTLTGAFSGTFGPMGGLTASNASSFLTFYSAGDPDSAFYWDSAANTWVFAHSIWASLLGTICNDSTNHVGSLWASNIVTEGLTISNAHTPLTVFGPIWQYGGTGNTTSDRHISIGVNAGTNGDNAVLIGARAGYSLDPSASQFAVMIGYGAGRYVTNGSDALMIGYHAGEYATNAGNSVMMGRMAGQMSREGTNATLLGYSAGRYKTNANWLTAVGYQAGNNSIDSPNGVYVGALADALNPSSNSIAIGHQATTVGDNDIVLGDTNYPYKLRFGTNILCNDKSRLSGVMLNNGAVTATSFTGNGAGVTNISRGLVTISAKGIKNNLSSVPNAGCDFGPDTAGTTTCGIQEAFDSMPDGTEYGPTATGIKLVFGEGYFYFTNALWFSNAYTYMLTMEGSSMLNTKLVYAGTAINTNLITVTGRRMSATEPWSPAHLKVQDLGFTALSNAPNNLFAVTNYGAAFFEYCMFENWWSLTNGQSGSGLSIGYGAPNDYGNPALVGIQVRGAGDHDTVLRSCFFAGLACGLDANCDHLHIYDFKTAGIGMDMNGVAVTAYPSSNLLSLGAAILMRNDVLDALIDSPHFYGCRVGLAIIHQVTSGAQRFQIRGGHLEGVNYTVVANKPSWALISADVDPLSQEDWISGLGEVTTNAGSFSISSTALNFISFVKRASEPYASLRMVPGDITGASGGYWASPPDGDYHLGTNWIQEATLNGFTTNAADGCTFTNLYAGTYLISFSGSGVQTGGEDFYNITIYTNGAAVGGGPRAVMYMPPLSASLSMTIGQFSSAPIVVTLPANSWIQLRAASVGWVSKFGLSSLNLFIVRQ